MLKGVIPAEMKEHRMATQMYIEVKSLLEKVFTEKCS